MGSILAIECDSRQAALLKCVVRNHVGAGLVVVASTREAIAAIGTEPPDLVLLSALLSPRDEEDAVAHLRGLNRADHLQTLTIPRFASANEEGERRGGGLLGAFSRKRTTQKRKKTGGCDPKQFAEQITSYLQRAEDIKAERAALEEAAAIAAREAAALLEAPSRPAPEPQPRVEPQTAAPAPTVAPDTAPLVPWATGVLGHGPDRWPGDDSAAGTGEIRSLLHALGLPLSVADLARAGGCRIRRVRVGASVASRRRAMTLVANPTPPPRTPAPKIVRRAVMSSYAAHA